MQLLDTLTGFFINNAYAADAAAQPQQGGGASLAIMIAIFIAFMYFAMLRPQSKRAKAHRDLIGSLNKGDEIVTAGGILGKVVKVTDSYIMVGLTDTVEIAVQKSSIVNVLPKGTLKSI